MSVATTRPDSLHSGVAGHRSVVDRVVPDVPHRTIAFVAKRLRDGPAPGDHSVARPSEIAVWREKQWPSQWGEMTAAGGGIVAVGGRGGPFRRC